MAKILIAEDDKFILNMYKVKFTNVGFEVLTAENGQDALALMASDHPDLVLMDLMMPILDGFEALQKAKADPAIKDIPIVVLTNLSRAEDAANVMKMGAQDYIVKSDIIPSELVEKIKKYLTPQ